MKENDSFSMCHPLLNFFYFAVALLFTMFNQHPVFSWDFLCGCICIRRIAEWMAKDPEAGSVADTSGTSDHSIAESYV